MCTLLALTLNAFTYSTRLAPVSSSLNSVRANQDTFTKLALYSASMFLLSLATFFGIARTPFGNFVASATGFAKDTAGVIAAVVVTYSIIGLYVWSAFNEKPDPKPAPSAASLRRTKAA